MMHRTITMLLFALFIIPGEHLSAQQTNPDGKHPLNTAKNAKVFKPPVYLGHSQFAGGPIKKDMFSDLLRHGLTSQDSLGNKYKVIGFNFGYAERNLYEDSVGNLISMMDYSNEYCPGDTISLDISRTTTTDIKDYLDGNPDNNDISRSIYSRAKPGDTIYFDQIHVAKFLNAAQTQLSSDIIFGRSFKCWIVK